MTFNKISRLPVIGDLAGVYFVYNTDTPIINGIYVKSTNESAAIKMGEVTETLNGSNYVMVYGTGTPTENAAELQAAYNAAKKMPRYLGIISDSEEMGDWYKGQVYNNGNYYCMFTETILNTNIGALDFSTCDESVAKSTRTTVIVAPGEYNFGASAFVVDTPSINVVSLTGCSDVIITSTEYAPAFGNYGIKVTADNVLVKGIDCKTNAFYIKSNLDNLICEYCVGGNYSFGGLGGTASGTFINCVGGTASFGNKGTASGTFNNCIGKNASFGTDGTASGTFINCVGGTASFGGGTSGFLSGKLINCKLTTGAFKTPTGEGKIYNCIDGNGNLINNPPIASQAPKIKKIVFDSTYIYKLTEEDNGATLIADANNMTSSAMVLFDYSALPYESLINIFTVTIVNVGYMNIGYYDGTTLTNLHTGNDKVVLMIREPGPYTYQPFIRVLN